MSRFFHVNGRKYSLVNRYNNNMAWSVDNKPFDVYFYGENGCYRLFSVFNGQEAIERIKREDERNAEFDRMMMDRDNNAQWV